MLLNNTGGGQARVHDAAEVKRASRAPSKCWVGKRREVSQKPQRDESLKRLIMFSISLLLSFVLNKYMWEGGDYSYSGFFLA